MIIKSIKFIFGPISQVPQKMKILLLKDQEEIINRILD